MYNFCGYFYSSISSAITHHDVPSNGILSQGIVTWLADVSVKHMACMHVESNPYTTIGTVHSLSSVDGSCRKKSRNTV